MHMWNVEPEGVLPSEDTIQRALDEADCPEASAKAAEVGLKRFAATVLAQYALVAGADPTLPGDFLERMGLGRT